MIVLGVMAPLLGPVLGMGEHKGKCPSCGTRMISVDDGKAHECPVCCEKFAIVEHHGVAGFKASS
jgi:tRNA(Ile2) C34 agmatinyltransferase TiaS